MLIVICYWLLGPDGDYSYNVLSETEGVRFQVSGVRKRKC